MYKKSDLRAHKYEICKEGCKLYSLNDEETECSVCHAPRYRDIYNQIPVATMNMMSIGDLLAQKLANPEIRQLLRYRADREALTGVYEDIFDGHNYKSLVQKGYFNNPDDIAIGLFTDGFVNVKKSGNAPYTIVHVIIYNFDPSIRYSNSRPYT